MDWRRHLPNALTMLRLVLAAGFFIALSFWRYDHADPQPLWPNIAVALFILAALTDALDGYLARRWRVVSAFGRIMDPVCDKVLVLGAFIYLAGPRFHMTGGALDADGLEMASGVYPWMVVLILFRELLITGLRGVAESLGEAFSATWWGKSKMILQTVAIPAALIVAANFDPAREESQTIVIVRDVLVYATLAVTVLSGLPYLRQFARVMREKAPRQPRL